MDDKVLIIAEAGVNHNGDMNIAKQLVDVAVEAGVDIVKFQTFKASNLVTKSAKKAIYQEKNTGNDDSQYSMLKKLELDEKGHELLIDYARSNGIEFLSTAFDLESLEYLRSLNIKLAKIPSGEITNLPYLRKVAKLFPRIILSTGMASMQEVKDAYNALIAEGVKNQNIQILHCNTEYPTPMEDVNLKAMLHIKEVLGVEIGYSDHTLGIEVPIAAVAMGAKVIEKHFTLDRNLEGPDHAASLEPNELKNMVQSIRNIEKVMNGDGKKSPSKSEVKNKVIARKSIVANVSIEKGEVFTEQNITAKRPGSGISPMLWDDVIGKKAIRSFNEDELIEI